MPEMSEKELLEARHIIWSRRFQFDRLVAFGFTFIGLLLTTPYMLFAASGFFLLTAIDAFFLRRAERLLEDKTNETTV